MKKLFTLLTALVMTVGAFAKDYTDTLTVTVNGNSTGQTATISLAQNEKGTYDFSLKNFVLDAGSQKMPIGNINLTDVKGETKNGVLSLNVDRNIKILPGDDPSIKGWMGPAISAMSPIPVRMIAEQRGDDLYTVINIEIPGQSIKVVFGNGGYQIKNSGFENYHTEVLYGMDDDGNKTSEVVKSAQVPNAWHSFMSASGYTVDEDGNKINSPVFVSLASQMFDIHTYVSDEVRPGSTGKHSAKVVGRALDMGFMKVTANGTITTGRMNAGSATADDVANNAWLDMDSVGVDENGDPFYTVMNGRPDSLAVWVKYNQGTVVADHPYATVSAVITDGTYYQEPDTITYNNIYAIARNNKIEATGNAWKRISIPFTVQDKNINGKAILVTISTNPDPGQGSEGDSILVDDIALIYNAPKATAITVDGDAVEGFADGKTVTLSKAYTNLTADDIVVTTDNENAKVFKTLEENNGTTTATIKVASNDLNSVATYTLTLPGTTTGIKAIDLSDAKTADAPDEIYNLAGQKVSNMQPGQVYVVKKGSKTVKVLKK